MPTASFFSIFLRTFALALLAAALWLPTTARAGSKDSITGQDANGTQVTLNGTGHYTLVLYTNPDLESDSREMTLALDHYRSRSDFTFIRVVDLRGGVPPEMRGIVRVKIREEQAKEALRLKKAGISAPHAAPIIPDFSGSTLNALGWKSTYDDIHVVVYGPNGKEIKRVDDVGDAKDLTKLLDGIL